MNTDTMTTEHDHLCRECGAVIGRGGDGCEVNADHDFALCSACSERQTAMDDRTP